jgi:hypothetical protein
MERMLYGFLVGDNIVVLNNAASGSFGVLQVMIFVVYSPKYVFCVHIF